jgi:hypothetical protein
VFTMAKRKVKGAGFNLIEMVKLLSSDVIMD